MARRPKPHPNPHAQLRAYQRNQVPSAYGEKAAFRAFSVGSANPDPARPSLAMVALTSLLDAATPTGRWMALPYTGSPACVDRVGEILRRSLGAQAPFVAIGGATTPVAFWVLGDLSCVLTERAPDGLRIYPSVVYLRQRDAFWTPTLLLGRGKARVPKLRLERAQPPMGWKAGEDRTAALFGERDLLTAPGYRPPVFAEPNAALWGDALRTDADHFHGAFDALEGHALWPAAATADAPQTRLSPAPWEPPGAQPSAWPPSLPHKGMAPHLAEEARRTHTAVAGWIAALRHTLGLPPATVLARPGRGKDVGKIEIFVLDPSTPTPTRQGNGPQHRARGWTFHSGNERGALPDALVQQLDRTLALPTGSRCVVDPGGGTWEGPWEPLVGQASGTVSAHTALATLGRWGTPSDAARAMWARAFDGR